MNQFYNDILVPTIVGIIATVSGWLVGKRQNNANAIAQELANSEAVRVKWQNWSEKLEAHVDKIEAQMKQQRAECERETIELKSMISTLQKQVNELQCKRATD
jgi:uncharacterized protein HemX